MARDRCPVWLAVLSVGLGLGMAACSLIACGDDDAADAAACRLGAERACSGRGQCRGHQRCGGDPLRWGSCFCDADPEPSDGGQPPPDAQAPKPRLGAPCDDDDDCPRGGLCSSVLGDAFFGGATALGTCVADCSSDADACATFASAACVPVAAARGTNPTASDDDAGIAADPGAERPSALCFERCALGAGAATKCHELSGVACDPLGADDASEGFCRPVCSTDAECGERACDRRTGACVPAGPLHDGTFGGACEPSAASACEGLCVELNDAQSLCSHRCLFGSSEPCADFAREASSGACVSVTPGGGIGDVGYCLPLCDCPEDCPDPKSVCDPFADATLERSFGALGACTAPQTALHEPLTCP